MVRFLSSLRYTAPALVLTTAALGGCAHQQSRDNYVVFFDRDSVSLSPTSEDIIAKAAAEAQKENAKTIRVAGSTGLDGDLDILKELANSRAKAVADRLTSDGVGSAKIVTVPVKPSPLEDSHVALRRVVITINPQGM
ncbi:OmpA family protein [Swingsia samuiensis]|uniref:OmpA-like domain-containing protein n=1 Tax=Swingsia samuiensis TaxID=1293412 RepID=A0A4Y6UM91_9PROT|nr:OmpA family protein [Swingsia samuiensis]QDH17900.1 hypothetical protein E3D00_10200 [Swingsia samuiensis]